MTLTREERMLNLAAMAILHGLKTRRNISLEGIEFDNEMRAPGACFVTLECNGQLRGCIGSAEAYRSLGEDLLRNAFSAAFNDIRFPRLVENELDNLEMELSILTHPKPIIAPNEDHLLGLLRPGKDGLIIEDKGAKALFLPSVWDSLPAPRDFLDNLKRKAGIGHRSLSAGFVAWRFETEKIKSSEILVSKPLWEMD
jgi:AmmeMemoRadiSam system protein A